MANASVNHEKIVIRGGALGLSADYQGIEGRCYNLAGDGRPTARDYTAMLAAALGRPLRYQLQSATWLWVENLAKWVVERSTGRRVPMPRRRDFLPRGLMARFDCSDAMRDLGLGAGIRSRSVRGAGDARAFAAVR